MTWSFAKQYMMKCFCSFISENYFLSDCVYVTALVFRMCGNAVFEVPLKARPMQHSKQLFRVVLWRVASKTMKLEDPKSLVHLVNSHSFFYVSTHVESKPVKS